MLAVGSIDPPASGTIAGYSSQGPTNDGRIAPDISAAGDFASTVKPTGFAGTSAASAVVAGGAALLLDGDLAADPRSLGNLIRHVVTDRGQPGPDNAYGYGEFRLPAPPKPVDATPSVFVPLAAPQRVLDTRPESAIGPANLIGKFAPGEMRDLPVLGQAGVPSNGVTAVVINLTATDVDQPTYVQALPTWRASAGGYSNINTDHPAQTRANFAIVPIGDGGTISLYTISGGHLVVDVLGYFTAAAQPAAAGRFVELAAPQRVLDTRIDGVPLANRVPRQVPSPAGVDMSQVQALVMTVTGTATTQPGWIQAFPTDRPDVIAGTSTVNLVPGISVANTAIIPVGANGVSVAGFFGTGSGHVVIDVVGYITSDHAPVDDQRTLRTGPAGAGVRLTHEHGRSHRRSADRDQCRCARRRDRRGLELRRDQRPPARVRAGVGGGFATTGDVGVQLVVARRDAGGGRDRKRRQRPSQGRARQRHRQPDHHRRRPDSRRLRLLHIARSRTG